MFARRSFFEAKYDVLCFRQNTLVLEHFFAFWRGV